MTVVALAVSGHGFGHAVRGAQVATALIGTGARVVVRTDAPRWLFPPEVDWLPSTGWPLDIGVVQHDGLELDVNATRDAWRVFSANFDTRAQGEAELLVRHRVDVVIGDIPPLAFAAAARANIRSFALGNFGWDWIYSAWPDFEDIIRCVQSGYASAERLLRLPLHATSDDAFPAFRALEDVPLIARKATHTRCEVRRALGVPEERCVVLLSFGGFAARGLNLAALRQWDDYLFVLTPPTSSTATTLPENVIALNETPADYVSFLAACDAVVTKPGYGIVADCLANRVPVLFTDRGPFREYDVLAAQLLALGRARYVPREELMAGTLGPHLDVLLASSAPWTDQPMNGADVVAQRVMQNLCNG